MKMKPVKMKPVKMKSGSIRSISSAAALALLGFIAVTNLYASGPTAVANHVPAANKAAAAGSAFASLEANATTPIVQEVVLHTLIKTSSTDLVLQVTAECALFTKLRTQGGPADSSTANAQVKMYIEIDDKRVPVSSNDNVAGDVGEVVFCDREHQQTTSFVNDDATSNDKDPNDEYLEQYLRTRTANAFNWIALNIAPGTHKVEVIAELSRSVVQGKPGLSDATAIIGKRTLLVTPERFPNGATIDPAGH